MYLISQTCIYVSDIQELRDISLEYAKTTPAGRKEDVERQKECISLVDDKMDNVVGRFFVENYFEPSTRDLALDMIDGLQVHSHRHVMLALSADMYL